VTAIITAPTKSVQNPSWEDSVKRLYEKRGCAVFKLHKRGWPDFLVIDWANYEIFLVEAKGQTDALRHHQGVVHERLHDAGLKVVIEWEPTTHNQDGRFRRNNPT